MRRFRLVWLVSVALLTMLLLLTWTLWRRTPDAIANNSFRDIQSGNWDKVWLASAGSDDPGNSLTRSKFACLAQELAMKAHLGRLERIEKPPKQDVHQSQYWLNFDEGRLPLRLVRAPEGWRLADSSLILALARSLPGDRTQRHAAFAEAMRACEVEEITDSIQKRRMSLLDIERAGRGEIAFADWSR